MTNWGTSRSQGSGAGRARRAGNAIAAVWLLAGIGLLSGSAHAFEAIDGRLQAHGYVEMQFRTISDDFSDQWDLTAWYNIFNLELELDMVQETHGILDLMSAYVRIEARFDCIYSRGCGMLRGANTFGNRSRGLPKRLQNGDEYTNAGSIPISNDGTYSLSPARNPYPFQQTPGLRGLYDSSDEGLGPVDRIRQMQCGLRPTGTGGDAYCPDTGNEFVPTKVQPRFWNADRNRRTVEPGSLTPVDDGTNGSPFLIAMQDFRDFKLTAVSFVGGGNYGNPFLILGPWLPENKVETNAALANLPNALDNSRVAPQSLVYGSGGRPMRPIPLFREDQAGRDQIWIEQTEPLSPDGSGAGDLPTGRWETINPTEGRFSDVRMWNDRAARPDEARGAFVPTSRLRSALQEDKFTPYPFNISQLDRAFNRGWSQNDEGELKEAYLDIEMFDSRLWLRIGKQSIVWGKTELFRTTDQFNPQDFALATLPSLEESRINLWAARGVWSFYEVGPLVDVRLELAMNFDQFEAADLGACGEPYTVNLVCALTFGSWAHGALGVGVAGFTAPPDPWENSRGLEFGGRLEWRWDRYSFALVDFYGYNDFPYAARLSTYSRNVDWQSGRPRYYMHTPAELAQADLRCLTPQGKGVAQSGSNDYDFSQVPNAAGAYVEYDGAANAGCLTRGASNRQVRVLEALPDTLPQGPGDWADGWDGDWYGVPFVTPRAPESDGNDYRDYKGIFLNNTVLSDAGDPRPDFSTPSQGDPNTDGRSAYLGYTQSRLFLDDQRFSEDFRNTVATCSSNPQYINTVAPTTPSGRPLGLVEECTNRGARQFQTDMYMTVNGVTLPNPGFNPFYDPRIDPYIDPRQATNIDYFTNPGDTTPLVISAACATGPNAVPSIEGSVRYDPFQVYTGCRGRNGNTQFWANAYDPDFEYDPRNSLDMASVNQSVFQFVCVNTVGFSALDPSACALTVFSSSKENPDAEAAPRISVVISAFIAGSATLNGFVGEFPTNRTLSKGPLLPLRMGIPVVQLHADMGIEPDADRPITEPPKIGTGLNAFRTLDSRRSWHYLEDANFDPYDPSNQGNDLWIYSREGESYNCLPDQYLTLSIPGGKGLCGGLGVGSSTSSNANNKFSVDSFLSKVLSPEQEALLGCGPYFLTSCDANGADFIWAEGSALLGSFMGSDSLGIALSQLGIEGLVPESYGEFLMDNGSPAVEFRADGRVVGLNGSLLRVSEGEDRSPVLGTLYGLLDGPGNSLSNDRGTPGADCTISAETIIQPDGTVDISRSRTSARCWDLRPYYVAFGLQPGTAANEILQLAGPKCTTADIGGPLDPIGGVLPGCRNKWATIQYQPGEGWDGEYASLHPNNPDAGYIGNNWYGQVFSYKETNRFDAPTTFDVMATPKPRADYRQWSSNPTAHVRRDLLDPEDEVNDSLEYYARENTPGNPCAQANNPDADFPGSFDGPESYDCYLRNPSYEPFPNDGNQDWLTTYGALQGGDCDRNVDPRCFYGPDGPDGEDLQNYLPASIRLHSSWAPTDSRYRAAEISRRSGLNWGIYDPALSGCDTTGRELEQLQDNPDCYVGGWRQTVDGDPDRLGIGPLYTGEDAKLKYPTYGVALGNGRDVLTYAFTGAYYGQWVQNGCTETQSLMFLQVDSSGSFISMPECVNVYQNPAGVNDEFTKYLFGAGHPFTGESFASEIAGASFNLMQLLVTFSSEFSDGLASVRAFVNPEIYESRFIYDEEWMWNPECLPAELGGTRSADECGGRNFVADINNVTQFLSGNEQQLRNNFQDSGCLGTDDKGTVAAPFSGPLTYQGYCLHSAYGNPNRNVMDSQLLRFDQGTEDQKANCVEGAADLSNCLRVRQAFKCGLDGDEDCTGNSPSENTINLASRVGWQGSGLGNKQANRRFVPTEVLDGPGPPVTRVVPVEDCKNSQVPGELSCYAIFLQNEAESRETVVPDPIEVGEENKLQRDPSLPNILTMFPDLLLQECRSARRDYQAGMSPEQIRGLYDNCGRVLYNNGQITADSGVNDWRKNAAGNFYQELRLGKIEQQGPARVVSGGLINTMLWDYAFTGTENDMMAMIPYCESLEYSQRFINETNGDIAGDTGAMNWGPTRVDCTKGLEGETLGNERCTYVTPQFCGLVQAVFSLAGQKRPLRRAGGNGTFGRRTMQWQSGNEVYLDYEKRNVLGFSMDFAEDYTKSNWSMEFTWIEGVPQFDSLSYDLTTKTDDFNLTVSVDRPTFINFLNANRTFFINSQWFFQYRQGWNDQFQSIGPWNVLATFAIFTGYFQDRLNPQLIFVYDFRSVSGGALPQINYRFSENFSITLGVSLFWGEDRLVPMGINPIAPAGPRGGANPYTVGIQPGLSIVRDRDEAFMILRYTF